MPFGAIATIFGASKSASSAKQNTQRQINWERERAKNAHQWEVEDLKKAGLNPILSAGGSGAVTGGITPQQPDTSGYSSAGQLMQEGVEKIANYLLQDKSINSQTDVNSATAGLIRQQQANEAAKNPYIAAKEKAEISEKAQRANQMEIENKFQKETYNHRLTERFSQIESAIAKGRIDISDVQFLDRYGITRREAIQLGTEGIKMIKDLVSTGMGAGAIASVKKQILKKKHSAK